MAQGDATGKQFLDLATGYLKRTPPEPGRRCSRPGWALPNSQAGAAEIPGLLLMADALHALDRDAQAVLVWQAVVERAPDNPAYRSRWTDMQRSGRRAGAPGADRNRHRPTARLRGIHRAAGAPLRFRAQDWVRLTPPVPEQRGDAGGRSDLCLRSAARHDDPHHAARRNAGRRRTYPGQGDHAAGRHSRTCRAASCSIPGCSYCRAARRRR